MPFVKLDCGIIHSSLWAEDSDTKICWITLLLLADATGFVRAAASAIAREAGISAEVARRALDLFQGPDDESRTPDNQGKRIERVDGGYRVLNYEKYRERDYTAAVRQKRFREKHKNNGVTSVTKRVTSRQVTHAEAEAEAEADKKGGAHVARPRSIDEVLAVMDEKSAREFWDYYESNGWRVGRNPMKMWKAAASRWIRNKDSQKNGWEFSRPRPKERAPVYPKMTEKREPTEAEVENARRIAHEETARFKEKMNNG